MGVPAEAVQMVWSHVEAGDADGGVDLVSASHHGVWRASMQKEEER